MKEPWKEHPNIWKTQATFMSFLRGGIRRSLWNKSPIKLEYIKKARVRIPNPNPKGRVAEVWGAECALCNKVLPIADIEVDHKQGNVSLNSIGDIQSFIESIVCVSFDDLQLVCKPCHKAKSYSEKQGISFKDAKIEKEVIVICSGDEKAWLTERGVVPAKNAKLRREQVRGVLNEEQQES